MKTGLKKDAVKQTEKFQIFLLLGAVGIFILYYPSLFFGFTSFDDPRLIVTNPYVTNLNWDTLVTIFSQPYWFNYNPLTILSWSIEAKIFGLDGRVYHMNNILLHLINYFLVYRLIKSLTSSIPLAVLAALMFAFHPLKVESVVWPAERKDVLYGMFYISALISYVQYWKTNKRKWYLITLAFFVLSCLSKAMAVSLSAMLFCIDFYYLKKVTFIKWKNKIPFVFISLFFGLLAVYTHYEKGIHTTVILSIPERLRYVGLAFWSYVYKSVFPINTTIFYPYTFKAGSVPLYLWSLPILMTLTLVFFIKKFKKLLIPATAIAIFTCGLIMVLQIIPAGSYYIADRYTYIASIGSSLIIAWCFLQLINKWRIIGIISLSLYLFYYLSTSNRFIKIWENNVSLFTNAIEQNPEDPTPYVNRAAEYILMKKYDEALEDCNEILRLDSTHSHALINRSMVKMELKDTAGAYNDLDLAYFYNPSRPNVLWRMMEVQYNLKQYEKVIKIGRLILPKDDEHFLPFFYLAESYNELKNLDSAIYFIDQGILRLPAHGPLHVAKINYYLEHEELDLAMETADKLLKIIPKHWDATAAKGDIYLEQGDVEKACEYWQIASGYGHVRASQTLALLCNKDNKLMENLRIKYKKVDSDSFLVMQMLNENRVVIEEGIIDVRGQYNGMVKWFYDSGKIKIVGFYKGEKPISNWEEFYENGNKMAVYQYNSEGNLHGSYQYYHDNNKLFTERIYHDGRLKSINGIYDFDGNPLKIGSFENGSGTVFVYDEFGKFEREELYENGNKK